MMTNVSNKTCKFGEIKIIYININYFHAIYIKEIFTNHSDNKT